MEIKGVAVDIGNGRRIVCHVDGAFELLVVGENGVWYADEDVTVLPDDLHFALSAARDLIDIIMKKQFANKV